MKTVLAGVLALVLAPIAAVGLFAAAYASSGDNSTGCAASTVAVPSEGSDACGDPGAATAFDGVDGYVDDPTSSGRITRRMLHVYTEANRTFAPWPWGIHCWDPHTWNPTSDHPLGRACDFTVGHIGQFPTLADRDVGWQLAHWAQVNAALLGISYIIWDGEIWSASRTDEGWRRYDGGGVYDPSSPTGGHYNHIHLSTL